MNENDPREIQRRELGARTVPRAKRTGKGKLVAAAKARWSSERARQLEEADRLLEARAVGCADARRLEGEEREAFLDGFLGRTGLPAEASLHRQWWAGADARNLDRHFLERELGRP